MQRGKGKRWSRRRQIREEAARTLRKAKTEKYRGKQAKHQIPRRRPPA